MIKGKKTKETSTLIEALKAILLSNTISTQEEIKHALEDQGFEINQTKISRLLHKMGAIKITNKQNQFVYSLPHELPPPTSQNVLSQLIITITANESIIIIHTNPGSASLIGRLLDYNRQELNILGTVAGDDTVFIAPYAVRQIKKTLQAIKSFLRDLS